LNLKLQRVVLPMRRIAEDMNMTPDLIAFWAFFSITVLAAIGVISLKNPVHAALSLVLTFFTTACLWLLLQAEFLGITLILVYVGAVMVLFLFVVMMLDINTTPLREGFARYFPIAMIVAAIMLLEILALLGLKESEGWPTLSATDPAAALGKSNVQWIGESLFTRYMLPFEIAAVILTVAIVIAVLLTLRRRTGTKTQDPAKQVMVRREDRVRLVKMKAETKQEPSP
jgi:NADH-quinone oxidoreductase subunit J